MGQEAAMQATGLRGKWMLIADIGNADLSLCSQSASFGTCVSPEESSDPLRLNQRRLLQRALDLFISGFLD